ncbi:lipid A-modifier LpxR family protein [Hyphobacterium sp. HN65]|uniref:Lipid A-modifier LpxR family protein n=1 Tax=Hyphobacterium lacteum TaxID=3116575 RepID=A0ABU7LNP1_9PROT|nr:lipid A-modifier LpxR family protein [Hyphobacterium sp. HN65]MEE2525527.1 lipid A-modifier LpxR family protein [Hyphobacterium sp. HN65]
MTRIDRILSVLFAAGLSACGSAWAQSYDYENTPAVLDVDQIILAPFLTSEESRQIEADHSARFVAASVLAETGDDNSSLAAFSGESTAINAFDDSSWIELRIFQPTLLTRSDRMFDPESDIDSAIVHPDRDYRSSVAVDYVTRFESHGGAEGLDLTIEPRAGFSFGPEGSGAGAGAEVRVGRYLQEDAARPSWYFFAGAERRALLYDPAEGWNMRGAMSLESYAVVGDAQAGIAMRLGDNDLSFAYVRRERNARIGIDDYDAADDFAAFSLSRRW